MYGSIYSMMTSSGMSTGDDGDDNERLVAAEELDSSTEISGCTILLIDDMIVRCLVMRSSCLDHLRLFRIRCIVYLARRCDE